MTKKVVTGFDDSPTASAAALKAAELAQSLGAELHVVSATDKLTTRSFSSGTQEVVVTPGEAAEAIANDARNVLFKDFPELTIVAESAPGKAADALVEYAESIDADLIVVGNKRVQGIGRVLGSIASDVAAHAPCDVYVAHTIER